MRKVFILLFLFAIGLFLFGHGNEHRTAEVVVAGKKITVEYGSPHLGDRDLASMVKPGMLWRMGADRTTSLTTDGKLLAEGRSIPAGSYGLLARNVSEDKWELLINSDSRVRVSSHDPEKDVAVLPLTFTRMQDLVDHLNIELKALGDNELEFSIAWGNMKLAARFQVAQG